MPPARKTQKRTSKTISSDVPVSSNYAISDPKPATEYNARTGRPIRKTAGQKLKESTYVDPDDAISDGDEDEDVFVEDVEDNICLAKKRKRSPSPPMTPGRLIDDNEVMDDVVSSQETGLSTPMLQPVSLTFNVPPGHSGPFVVNLDVNSFVNASHSMFAKSTLRSQPYTPSADSGYESKSRGTSELNPPEDLGRSRRSDPTKEGFLSLSGELRNKIYRLLFVTEDKVDFGHPRNFGRSSHFLATCKQVHDEGRSILYSENTFYLQACKESRTRRFESGTYQIGYKDIRYFLRTMGPDNVSLIRHVILLFEDLIQSLNPHKRNADDRRFTSDDDLRAVLRLLGDHGRLQTLKLSFQGRRLFFTRDDERFTSYLVRVKADTVQFIDRPEHTYNSESKTAKHTEKELIDEMQRSWPLYLPRGCSSKKAKA